MSATPDKGLLSNPDYWAALCTCGAPRTVKMGRRQSYSPPGWDYTDGTCDLKCGSCGDVQIHAVCKPEVAPSEVVSTKDNTNSKAVELRDLDTADIRVRWTSDLEERVVWLPKNRLLLLDHSITHAQAVAYVRDIIAE